MSLLALLFSQSYPPAITSYMVEELKTIPIEKVISKSWFNPMLPTYSISDRHLCCLPIEFLIIIHTKRKEHEHI